MHLSGKNQNVYVVALLIIAKKKKKNPQKPSNLSVQWTMETMLDSHSGLHSATEELTADICYNWDENLIHFLISRVGNNLTQQVAHHMALWPWNAQKTETLRSWRQEAVGRSPVLGKYRWWDWWTRRMEFTQNTTIHRIIHVKEANHSSPNKQRDFRHRHSFTRCTEWTVLNAPAHLEKSIPSDLNGVGCVRCCRVISPTGIHFQASAFHADSSKQT